jgi:hypothetical protein
MLTEEEKKALTVLLDLAVKAGGIRAAQSALYFADKFELTEKPKKGNEQE